MKQVIDEATLNRSLTRITHEILEHNNNVDDTVLVGIKTRGIYLAKRLQERLLDLYQVDLEVLELDISGYRDDKPSSEKKKLGVDLTNRKVILVDDVLYTGRSIRAALDALVENGRPAQIQLVTLVDRGHREFPIRPDYVGKNLPTSRKEKVVVHVKEVDDEDGVFINKIE